MSHSSQDLCSCVALNHLDLGLALGLALAIRTLTRLVKCMRIGTCPLGISLLNTLSHQKRGLATHLDRPHAERCPFSPQLFYSSVQGGRCVSAAILDCQRQSNLHITEFTWVTQGKTRTRSNRLIQDCILMIKYKLKIYWIYSSFSTSHIFQLGDTRLFSTWKKWSLYFKRLSIFSYLFDPREESKIFWTWGMTLDVCFTLRGGYWVLKISLTKPRNVRWKCIVGLY